MSETHEILGQNLYDTQSCLPDPEEVPILGLIEVTFHQLMYVKQLLPKNCFRKVMWRGIVTYMCIDEEVNTEIMGFLKFVGDVISKNPQSQVYVIFKVERVMSDDTRIVIEEYTFSVNGPEPPNLKHNEFLEMIKEIVTMSCPLSDEAENQVLDYDFEMKIPPPLVVPVARNNLEWHVGDKEEFKPCSKLTKSSENAKVNFMKVLEDQ